MRRTDRAETPLKIGTAKYWWFIGPSIFVILSVVLFPWLFTIWMSVLIVLGGLAALPIEPYEAAKNIPARKSCLDRTSDAPARRSEHLIVPAA